MFLGKPNNIRALEQLNPQDMQRLKSHLKGVNIVVMRPGQRSDGQSRRQRPIKDIVPQAGLYQFEKDGVTTTVQACT